MVFASSYIFDRLLITLDSEGVFESIDVFEKLSKRYEDDADLQRAYSLLKTYFKNENPEVLNNVKATLQILKNSRKVVESGYNGGLWYSSRRR